MSVLSPDTCGLIGSLLQCICQFIIVESDDDLLDGIFVLSNVIDVIHVQVNHNELYKITCNMLRNNLSSPHH